jgi:hypothetical protein
MKLQHLLEESEPEHDYEGIYEDMQLMVPWFRSHGFFVDIGLMPDEKAFLDARRVLKTNLNGKYTACVSMEFFWGYWTGVPHVTIYHSGNSGSFGTYKEFWPSEKPYANKPKTAANRFALAKVAVEKLEKWLKTEKFDEA